MKTHIQCKQYINSTPKQKQLIFKNYLVMFFFFAENVCLFVNEAQRPSSCRNEANAFFPGFNQYCRELMCLAQGHNRGPPVGIEPCVEDDREVIFMSKS